MREVNKYDIFTKDSDGKPMKIYSMSWVINNKLIRISNVGKNIDVPIFI